MNSTLLLTVLGGASFSIPRLFAGGVPGAFYDISDLSTLFQDTSATTPVTADGDPVGYIGDKSGNGNHSLQGTASAKLTYKTAGGLHWVEGDGTADYTRAAFTIAQPWDRITAIRQITWTSSDRIFGGATAVAGLLQQITGSPQFRLFDGNAAGPVNGDLAVGSDGVVIERHDGASSRLGVNNNAYATGNAGTTAPGGWSILAEQTGTAPANARFYGGIMVQKALSDKQISQVKSFFASKCGLTL